MTRLACLWVLVLLVVAVVTAGSAQNPPPRGGQQQPTCVEGCGGGDLGPPTIELHAPLAPVSVQYPTIEIWWCDDQSLNAATRWITLNGQGVTTSFTYVTGGPPDCTARKKSVSSSVAVNVGDNPLSAHICDNVGQCTTQDFTITRVQLSKPTLALHNFNGDNQDRGLCLTIGAGQAAGLSCGDLIVTHGMPAYRTMGRDRSLTLVYNSASAAPRPVVAVWVTQPGSAQTPDNVTALLRVNGALKASATYSAIPTGQTRQLALAYDASGDASGLYPFTLEVRNVYGGVPYADSVSGTLTVVNRGGSEFGAGWWLAGLEQLVLGQSGNRILWLGGDGSAAVYTPVTTNVWARAAGGYRDTLVYSGGLYTRTLRHGVQVVFDGLGRHIRTVNRAQHTTTFTWSGSPVRLTSIQVPPGVSGTTYSLAYDGSSKLDYVTDPASRVLNATVSGGTLTSLTDPDNAAVSFSYDGRNRMTGRQTRRGFWTRYLYGDSLHVTRVAIPLDPGAAPPRDSARTTLQWWDALGLAFNSPAGTLSAADTATVYTQADGPRTDVADVAKFWVDRWRAPVKIVGAVSDTTVIARDAASGLVTMLRNPVHDSVTASYNGRGNLLSVTDQTHEGHGTGGFLAATTRYTYSDPRDVDSPDSIIDPEGVATRFVYSALGFDSLAIAPTGQVTRFLYYTGASAGLVQSVTDLQVPTYTDTVSWSNNPTTTPTDQTTSFTYVSLGNVATSVSPMGHTTQYVYNGSTQVDSVIDALGQVTRYFNRPMGVVDSVAQRSGTGDRRYANTYDNDFSRLSFRDPRGVTRSWAYDAAGRDTAETDDYGNRERRLYGPSGLLDSLYARTNVMVRRTYDPAGRLTQLRFPNRAGADTARGDTVNLTYDAAGHVLTASNRTGTIARQYYREGTLKLDQQSTSFYATIVHAYRYDRADRRTWNRSIGTANDTLLVAYDYVAGLLNRLAIDYPSASLANDTATYAWDGLGRRQQVVTPHRATVRWFYDLDGRLRRIYSTHQGASPPWNDSAAVDRRYRAYDRLGRPLSISEQVGQPTDVDSFAYDAFGQMRFRAHNGTQRFYTYDLSGNLTTEFDQTGVYGRRYGVQPAHNWLAADTSYDQAGAHPRLSYVPSLARERIQEIPYTSYNLWRDFWFDALGRMASVGSTYTSSGVLDANDGSSDTLYYTFGNYLATPDVCRYDALGRRVKPCGGLAMAYEDNQVDWVQGTRIIYGPALDDPIAVYDPPVGYGQPQLHYFLTDGGGRLLSYTDRDGYDQRQSFNNVYTDRAIFAGATNNAESFGGSAREAGNVADVSFFRSRYYDQRTGRWLTEDPIGVAGGANLYQYVGNNPATYTDPFGLCKDEDGKDRPCTVEWAPEASNTNITDATRRRVQAIADKADVDLVLSSGRRAEGSDCSGSLHNCGHAVDIKAINGVDVGRLRQANPDAMDLVQRVQGVAMGMSEVRENFGPLGLWRSPAAGQPQTLIGIVVGSTSYFGTPRAESLWNGHQNHVHIGIW